LTWLGEFQLAGGTFASCVEASLTKMTGSIAVMIGIAARAHVPMHAARNSDYGVERLVGDRKKSG
jgi:hypothetical protein